MSKDELPSIFDHDRDRDNLPSYKDFLEKKEENLPSVNDFLKEEVVEKTQTIENLNGQSFLEVTDVVSAPDWSELVRLINDVRKDIPKIPEIRYYDEELEKILKNIDEIRENIPEVVYYDQDISSLKEEINQVKGQIPEIPEIRYYEGDIEYIHTKINLVKEQISKLPEVKYYDEDVESLKKYIGEVKDSIPEFPDWVNQVNEVPDFSWIGKTFSCIDDDFNKVQGHLDLIREKIKFEVSDLNETIETKEFEFKVDLKNLEENIKETKDRIWKELRETSTRIWDHHNEYKDDDRKLKKQILGEYNLLKQKVKQEVEEYNRENSKYQEKLLTKFKFVEEKVENLDIRYYDEDIESIQKDIKSTKTDISTLFAELKKIAEDIKTNQQELKENYLLSEPPDQKQRAGGQSDPLTPTGEKFATFKDLEQHYRLFLNRIQVQMSTIGGGGAGFIKDLDDVSFDQTTGNNKLLIYDQANSKWVGIASTAFGGSIGIQSSGTLIKDGVKTLNFIGLGNTFSVNGDTVDISIQGGGAGAGGTWGTDSVGIHTIKSVGIGTTSAKSGISLYVLGDAEISGNITVGGTITYEDVTNVDSIGLITARSGIRVTSGGIVVSGVSTLGIISSSDIFSVGIITANSFVGNLTGDVTGNSDTATFAINAGVSTDVIGGISSVTQLSVSGVSTFTGNAFFNNNILHTGIATFGSSNGIGTVHIGIGTTALLVDGNARVTGILTVGRSSITIDGDNNTITSGIVTITNSTIYLGDNITLNAGATGINSAPNVLYVAKDGSDENNGTSIDNAFLTISAAVGIATTGTIVKVLAGNYLENNPIDVPAFVSIVGDDLKTVTVSPNNANKDIFHVRKGCYLANMTFTNHISPATAVGFPTSEIATNVGGGKWESPYIQNCTSNTTTGTGLRIDGNQAEGLKSIVCDSYTQYNQGGVGVAITNGGYAQLVSVFTICCDVGISCHKGAQCSLTNSNTSFGTYGLVADGTSDLQFSGIVTTSATAGQDTVTVAITTTTRPYDGQVVFFNTLYYTVESITVTNSGSGYLTTPSVTISSPDGPNGQTATAFATLDGDSVQSITIISSGNQYSSAPTVTISAPDSGVTATATANVSPIYYTINSSTPVTAGITTLTLDENLNNTVGVGSTAYFYQLSRINASSHTFEYVGSGNDITTATPLRGGVPIQENEVVETSGGVVIYTSTDQSGNFRIGNGLQINQNTGTISGRAFTRSLFSEMTPFILALS